MLKIKLILRSGFLVAVVSLLAVLVFTDFAHAQSSRDIDNRLRRLENEVDTLSRSVFRSGSVRTRQSAEDLSQAEQAGLEVRLQQLEQELRAMRGAVEEQEFAVRQLKNEMDKKLSDIELRIGDLEGVPGGSASRAAPPPIPETSDRRFTAIPPRSSQRPAPPVSGGTLSVQTFDLPEEQRALPPSQGVLGTITTTPDGEVVSAAGPGPASEASPTELYERAFSLLKNGQYGQAEDQFRAFLSEFSAHNLAGNAQYWLGETYYVRGDFERAARTFAEGYQKYPKGSKAADNLLKLGMSLAGMGNNQDACVALNQLAKDFPSGADPVLRRAQQEMSRMGC